MRYSARASEQEADRQTEKSQREMSYTGDFTQTNDKITQIKHS